MANLNAFFYTWNLSLYCEPYLQPGWYLKNLNVGLHRQQPEHSPSQHLAPLSVTAGGPCLGLGCPVGLFVHEI